MTKTEILTFRCTREIYEQMEEQMAILGILRMADYIRIAIEEKISRDNYSFSEQKVEYQSDRPKRFDAELKRALVSNKDVQKIIVDIVEKSQRK